jgi:predicted metal-dependent hydrolase
MTSGWQHLHSHVMDDRLARAIHLFNRSEWYAAHDAFEELWHEASGDERHVFHGIIQSAVAEHHLLNGNTRGSLLLMAEGLNHLNQSPSHLFGIDLEALKVIIRQRLARLQTGQMLDDLPLPHLQPSAPGKD